MLQDNIFAFYDIPNLAMPRSEHSRKTQYKIGLSYNEVIVSTVFFKKVDDCHPQVAHMNLKKVIIHV
jgi:hypothetical protein